MLVPQNNIKLGIFSLIIGLVSAVLAWQQNPSNITLAAEDKPNTLDDWHLNSPDAARNYTALYDKLRYHPFWQKEKRGESKVEPKKEGHWRLVGIVWHGAQPSALFINEQDSKRVKRLQINHALPNQSILVSIHPDFVEMEQDGKIKKWYLYPQKKL